MLISKKLFNLLTLLLVFTTIAYSQILDPVDWSFESEKTGDNEYVLKFIADIDDGWTVYSQFTDDAGPVPTTIEFDDPSLFEKIGESTESGKKKEGFDKIFQMDVIKFLSDKPFEISQKIRVKDLAKPITGYLTYMTCDKTKCLPPTDEEFSFSFASSAKKQSPDSAPDGTTQIDQTIEVDQQQVSTKANTSTKVVEEKVEKAVEQEPKINITQKSSGLNLNVSGISEEDNSKEESKILTPVKWSFNIEDLGNEEYNLVYTASIDENWNVYSQKSEEGGPVPTSFEYESIDGAELIGEAAESGYKKEGPDPLFDNVNVIKYTWKEDFVVKQKVKVSDASKPIKGYLTYMTCDDTRCLNPTDIDFLFDIKNNIAKESVLSDALANESTNSDSRWPVMGEPASDCIESIDTSSLFWTFIQGLGFGLLALLTPCVFPMIPLTVSFFTKKSTGEGQKKRSGTFDAILYGVCIFLIYLLVSVPFWIANIPTDTLNVIATSVVLNLIFFAIFLFFAFSFFGYYELTLPSNWGNKTDSLSGAGGIIGIFFMALTLVIVSFSCTGPLLGVVLAQTISGGNAALTSALAGFGLALGLPFALFALFPSMLEKMPKSGGWLNTVKVVLGFIELGLALKFLSNADLVSQWGFLKREVFLGIWIILAILMVLYLLGIIRFPHDGPKKAMSKGRLAMIFLFSAFAGYLIPGLFGKNLTLLSGFPPPMHYSYFHHEDDKLSKLNIFKDYDEGMAFAKKEGKPVMLDFTGWACVNCRKMEENVWVQDEIYNKLDTSFVIISLYVDEKTKLSKEEQYVSPVSNKKIRTVGNLWSDFEVTSFVNNSQPLYVLMTAEEELLNVPVPYTPDVKDYSYFLDCGLKAFEELK